MYLNSHLFQNIASKLNFKGKYQLCKNLMDLVNYHEKVSVLSNFLCNIYTEEGDSPKPELNSNLKNVLNFILSK